MVFWRASGAVKGFLSRELLAAIFWFKWTRLQNLLTEEPTSTSLPCFRCLQGKNRVALSRPTFSWAVPNMELKSDSLSSGVTDVWRNNLEHIQGNACWWLVFGVVGCLLVVYCWLLVVGCWLLVGGRWLVVGGWLLVVGGWWWLVVGGWLLVGGC